MAVTACDELGLARLLHARVIELCRVSEIGT